MLVTLLCVRDCFAIPGAGEAIGASHTPFDLHVLGTPPAFVLSQDQTLEFNLSVSLNTVAHFFRLVVFLFASVILDLSIGIDLACLLMHYIVFKVLSPPLFCDSFCSIPQLLRFVNTFFSLFLKFFSPSISCVSFGFDAAISLRASPILLLPFPLVNPLFVLFHNIFLSPAKFESTLSGAPRSNLFPFHRYCSC